MQSTIDRFIVIDKGSNYIKSFIFSILLTIIIFSPFMIIAIMSLVYMIHQLPPLK